MKTKFYIIALIVAAPLVATAQSFQNFENGISLGTGPASYLYSWPSGAKSVSAFEAQYGGIVIYSGVSETANSYFDGGVSLCGKPISMILGAANEPAGQSIGTFDVWRDVEYWAGQSLPVFRIDTGADTATFNSINVSITGGNLSIEGSPAITTASASSILTSQGFIQQQTLASSLENIAPPISTHWSNRYVTRGNVSPNTGHTVGGFFALGNSTASGAYSLALGSHGTATASAHSSLAMGYNVTASGVYSNATGNATFSSAPFARAHGYKSSATGGWSTASGNNAVAGGIHSFSHGLYSSANSGYETVFGRYNLESGTGAWSDMDGLFRLGNGDGTTTSSRSDALTVLKNGQTKLTNKYWKISMDTTPGDPTVALNDPPMSTTDSGGNALIVDGHTVLNGKVIISVPQGDISMGIYE